MVAIVLGLGTREKERRRQGFSISMTAGGTLRLRLSFAVRSPILAQDDKSGVELECAGSGQDLEILDRRVLREQDSFEKRFRNGFWGHHFLARSLRPQRAPDVGVGGAGKQADHADAARAEFFPQCVGKAQGGVLGRIVGGGPGEGAGGGNREIIHDGRAGLHDRERGLGHQKSSVEVRSKDISPDGIGELVDGEIGVRDPGVVDEDIELKRPPPDGAEEVVDRVGIADVAGLRQDADLVVQQFPAESGKRFLIACSDDEVAGFAREGFGEGAPDTACGAGDESALSAKASGAWIRCSG